MSLKERLKTQIRASGPFTMAQFMAACLHDAVGGYYSTRPNLGPKGDFITAPMISQMFGELIGLWASEVWAGLGRPRPFVLAEIGPGDGALMEDALRAARAAPGFLEAAEVWLVESSAPLRRLQEARLAKADPKPAWAESLTELPHDRPIILIGNEVLDCMPARQFVRTESGWAERMLGLSLDDELTWGLAAQPEGMPFPDAEPGSVFELSSAQSSFGAEVGRMVARHGGAALLIDYGRDAPGFGDTLQALVRHRKVDPLEDPGLADLTVHADFPEVLRGARDQGAETGPIVTQGRFLERLGIFQRAQHLSSSRPDRAEVIARQLERLTGADQMGDLFKAAVIYAPKGLCLPGFQEGVAL